MRHPGRLPATTEPVVPKRGMRFVHVSFAGADGKHSVCRVTAVRQDRVYWAFGDSKKASWYTDGIEKFAASVAEILPDEV